jgi:protein subunit release factor A
VRAVSDEHVDVAHEPGEVYEGELDPEVFRIELWSLEGGFLLTDLPSGVRLTHLPGGLVAESFSSESQVENRDAALEQLRELLRERGQEPTFEVGCARPGTLAEGRRRQ